MEPAASRSGRDRGRGAVERDGDGGRGESMSGQTAEVRDRDRIYQQRFDARLRAHLRSLVTPALIAEHRANPVGRHSDALERVLNHFRRAPLAGKYALFELEPNRKYRIVATTARDGGPPRDVGDPVYTDKNDALHAVFLKRVEELMETGS